MAVWHEIGPAPCARCLKQDPNARPAERPFRWKLGIFLLEVVVPLR